MTPVFADTFYWVALTSEGDDAHEQALVFSRSLRPDKLITTEDVLDEYLAHFSRARPSIRLRAGNAVAALRSSTSITVIPQRLNYSELNASWRG